MVRFLFPLVAELFTGNPTTLGFNLVDCCGVWGRPGNREPYQV